MGLETDPLKQDSLKRAIENAKSELQTIKSSMNVRETLFKEIAILQQKSVQHLKPAAKIQGDTNLMLKRILGHEGGLDLRDMRKGGLSYAGITQSAYDDWMKTLKDTSDIPTDVEVSRTPF